MARVELREKGFAVGFDGGTRRPESFPQIVALGFWQPGSVVLLLLPAGEDFIQGGAHLLPLRLRRILSSQSFGFQHDGRAFGDRRVQCRLRVGGLLLGEFSDGAVEGIESGLQCREIADGTRRCDARFQRRNGPGHVGTRCAAFDALLQQSHLPGQFAVLALEVGQRLLGCPIGVLSDRTLAVSFSNEDGTGLIDTAPRCLLACHQKPHLAVTGPILSPKPIAPRFVL